MPRKPKPPLPLITVQGLSDYKSFPELTASYVCDITGEVQPISTEVLTQHVINNPKVITDYRKRIRAVRMVKEYLEAKQYLDQRERARKMIADKINPPEPKPKLTYNQVLTESGRVITPIVPRKPWRRL